MSSRLFLATCEFKPMLGYVRDSENKRTHKNYIKLAKINMHTYKRTILKIGRGNRDGKI